MATTTRTVPGVYVTELPAFPPSIVGVQTAVPIFVGYTEFAVDPVSQKPVYMQAIQLTSMADYYSWFGHGYDSKYGVVEATVAAYDFEAVDTAGALKYYDVNNTETVQYNLYTALKLFYANGGGTCYVVSVANYWNLQSTTPPNLYRFMVRAMNKIPSMKMGKAAFYVNRAVKTWADIQAMEKPTLAFQTINDSQGQGCRPARRRPGGDDQPGRRRGSALP